MNEAPQVLVVGAGAVGQVFGRHLARGGAHVTFLVRPQYVEATKRGFEMVELVRFGPRHSPAHFLHFEIVSSMDEVAHRRFDRVYLAIPSPLDPTWIAGLARASGTATIVSLQPSPEDHDTMVTAGIAPDRLVSGLIGFVSFTTPLEAETHLPSGTTAYWFPPLAPSLFSGPQKEVDQITSELARGELPAGKHADIPRFISFATAILTVYLMALELAGWSLRRLRASDLLEKAARAADEAIAVMTHDGAAPPLLARLATWPWLMRVVLFVAPFVPPFPLAAYLKKHFTKVGDQTRAFADLLATRAEERGTTAKALLGLRESLGSKN